MRKEKGSGERRDEMGRRVGELGHVKYNMSFSLHTHFHKRPPSIPPSLPSFLPSERTQQVSLLLRLGPTDLCPVLRPPEDQITSRCRGRGRGRADRRRAVSFLLGGGDGGVYQL